MKKIFLTVLPILIVNVLLAQYSFSGIIENYNNRELNICTQFGDESKLIQTVKTDNNGNFIYKFTDEKTGLYRIYLDNKTSFDIIYNKENIHLKTRSENPQYNMEVVDSKENIQLYEYYVNNYIFDYKIDVLSQMLEIYPKEEKFYNKVGKELKTQTKLKNKHIDKVIKENPNSFTGRYLKAFRTLNVPTNYTADKRKEYVKNNYFKFYKMEDTILLRSNAYNEIVLNYFKLFKSNNQDVYYEAAKTILDEIFFGEPVIFNFVMEYILAGFESLNLNEAAAKISIEYGDLCSDNENDGTLKMRIKNNTKLAIGETAPDFTVTSISGNTCKLSEMTSDYTLLFFWATWCPHCKITLPHLVASENIFKQANMNIITVSVDSDKDKVTNFIKENNLPWETICECKGWDGDIVVDYAVFATPYMVIVDKNMKIVQKPYNEEKLFQFLEEIIYKK